MRNNRLKNTVFNSRSRRRGQALLLSVLVMIFIVLLGTTFIAIVASNMSNTARTGSKDEARQAAKAGINFADSQLTGSASGLDWRPEGTNPPSGNFYYSSFDNAQGWSQPFYTSQTGSVAKASFVKYPNPQGTSPSGDAANFMIRVSQVQSSDPDNTDNTKTGDIRIESIGFANDDPAAYYEVVAYKNGPANNPLTAAMRSVTNWDFNAATVPQGYLNVTGPGITTQGPTLTLSNATGYFDPNDCPFYVTITTLGAMDNTYPPQMGSAEVTGVTYVNGEPQLTIGTTQFNVNISSTNAALLVQKAANLGAPLTVNYDNANSTPVDYRISGANNFSGNPVNSPGSVWVNGGLVWFGTNPTTSGVSNFDGIKATNLVAPSAATATNPASILKVSGLFTSTILSPTATPVATVQVSGLTSSGTVSGELPSDSTSTPSTNPLITSGLVNDGLNRLQGSQDPTRQVQSFTPPDITSGGDGFGRYRQLTKYSTSTNASYPQAAVYGYGQGIYINNPTDVEKIGTTPMTQTQLHNLWFTPGTAPSSDTVLPTSYERAQIPAPPTSTTNSLEDQHMRGWVSPSQFLPRGAEVIINNNNTITVNLDPLEDNSATYPNANFASTSPTPDPTKGWRNVDGSLAGNSTYGGVYSQTFNWPANGTLFAEGNIRIRGVDNNATSSLTVVSMNNIYIDGSLKLINPSGASAKVLLLAKKNVVVNPTQVLEDIQAVTTLSAIPTAGATSISVNDLSNFEPGDYITIAGGSSVYGISTKSALTGAGTLTLNSALPATFVMPPTVAPVVQTAFDPRTDVGAYQATDTNRPYTTALRLSQPSDVIQRRVQWPNNTTNIRLAFRHSAEYRNAVEFAVNQATPNPTPPPPSPPSIASATLTNKINLTATSPEDLIQAADKAITVTYTENPLATPSPGTDTFPATPPADQPTAAAYSLNSLVSEMEAKRTAPNWNYGSTATPATKVDPNYNPTTPPTPYNQPPYYFLASSGSRYPFPNQYTPQPTVAAKNAYPPASEPSAPIFPQPTSGVMNLPMATSVWLLMNNTQTSLSLFPGLDIVNQLGFSPIFTGAAQDAAEDVLTTDQYFYQPHMSPPPPPASPTGPDPAYPHYYPGLQDNTTADATFTPDYVGQSNYDTRAQYTFDSRTLGTLPQAGSNEIVLQQNNATVNSSATPATTVQSYFTSKTSPTDAINAPMPFYRLSSLKLQNETFDSSSPPNLNSVSAGTTFDINAYVYAQDGGWYIIPGTNFDQSQYPYSATDTNNIVNNEDLNRDGVISQGESAAAYQYHRYNYQIAFTGSIMENQTAAPVDVREWMDKWATVNLFNANFSGGSVVSNTSLTYDSSNPATSNFGGITYFYDPTAAKVALATDPGFHAPVAPGLTYQG